MNADELATLATLRRSAASGVARAARLAAGLSLGEVASAVGVTASTVMRWERGERAPQGAPALAYAEVLRKLRRRTGGHANRQPSRSAEAEPTLRDGPDVATSGATSPETRR